MNLSVEKRKDEKKEKEGLECKKGGVEEKVCV